MATDQGCAGLVAGFNKGCGCKASSEKRSIVVVCGGPPQHSNRRLNLLDSGCRVVIERASERLARHRIRKGVGSCAAFA